MINEREMNMNTTEPLPYEGTRLEKLVAKTKLGQFVMKDGGSLAATLFVLAPKVPGARFFLKKLMARS